MRDIVSMALRGKMDIHRLLQRKPSVLIEEEYDQLKKEGNALPLGLKWVDSMFGTSFTFLIMLDLD